MLDPMTFDEVQYGDRLTEMMGRTSMQYALWPGTSIDRHSCFDVIKMIRDNRKQEQNQKQLKQPQSLTKRGLHSDSRKRIRPEEMDILSDDGSTTTVPKRRRLNPIDDEESENANERIEESEDDGDDSDDDTEDGTDQPLKGVLDPITGEVMTKPTICDCGHVLDKDTWSELLENKKECPYTQKRVRIWKELTEIDRENWPKHKDSVLNLDLSVLEC